MLHATSLYRPRVLGSPTFRVVNTIKRADGGIRSTKSIYDKNDTPWTFAFDLRERETEWTEELKVGLLKTTVAQKMEIGMADLEGQLNNLSVLVPDLGGRIGSMKFDLLLGLLTSMDKIPGQLLLLKEIFPQADISAMVTTRPQLLLEAAEGIRDQRRQLTETLGTEEVDRLVQEFPVLLDVEGVEEVLEEMRRLMPAADVQGLLRRDPSWIMRVQRGQKRLGQHPDSDLNEQI